MMTQEQTLADPRLGGTPTLLRRFTTADAPAFAAINRDPLNVKWAASEAEMDTARAAELIDGHIAAGWTSGNQLRFAVVEQNDGAEEVIGTVSLQDVFSTDGGGSASVGIKMLPAGRGTGSAARAIELLCTWAFEGLGLEILHWRSTAGNDASTGLAARSGFGQAAHIPGYGHVDGKVSDGVVLSQTAAQWAARGGSPAAELDPEPVIPVLRGDKVVLRALTMADTPVLVENCINDEAVRWTTVPLGYTLDHAEFFIKEFTPDGWKSGKILTFAVADPATDMLLGTVDLQCKKPGAAAIGLNFGEHARGTGAAEAAMRLLLDYAFNQLNVQWVHWHALVPNWGSRKLAWKLGFHFDGQLRGGYNDRGTPGDRWVLSLAAGEPQTPQEPWTGPAPVNR